MYLIYRDNDINFKKKLYYFGTIFVGSVRLYFDVRLNMYEV